MLDLGSCSISFSRFDNMDHLDLAIAKESKTIISALCTTSGKTLGNESVLTALMPKKPIVLSAIRINTDQGALEWGINR